MISDQGRRILTMAEVKRIEEKLTKKELANIYGLSYNYYINCLTWNNNPSAAMLSKLTEYINTPSSEVYKMVFNFRGTSDYLGAKKEKGYLFMNDEWKEDFRQSLGINVEDYLKIVGKMREENTIDV